MRATPRQAAPSRRYGMEWTNQYRPVSWLSLDGDVAMTHARFIGYDADQAAAYASLAGHSGSANRQRAGQSHSGAPNMVISGGIRLGEKSGWFSGLRYRYFGPRPLTEDGAFISPATGLLYGEIGYRFENGWRIQLDGLESDRQQIGIRSPTPMVRCSRAIRLFTQCLNHAAPAAVCANGVMDSVLHPVEPLAVRLTVAGSF